MGEAEMAKLPPGWIVPQWPAPAGVRAFTTTREGGISTGVHAQFNVGDAVGDDAACVSANRARLRALVPGEPRWLRQVHGTRILSDEDWRANAVPEADGSATCRPGEVLVIQTADCLPVLLASRDGRAIAAAHAGWRGLAGGVIENAVHAMGVPPSQVIAWLGPAIGAAAYQVGGDVQATFSWADPDAAAAFADDVLPGRYRMDMYALARLRLNRLGIASVHGGGHCTFSEPARFYSYRRDGQTGRMATLLWMEP